MWWITGVPIWHECFLLYLTPLGRCFGSRVHKVFPHLSHTKTCQNRVCRTSASHWGWPCFWSSWSNGVPMRFDTVLLNWSTLTVRSRVSLEKDQMHPNAVLPASLLPCRWPEAKQSPPLIQWKRDQKVLTLGAVFGAVAQSFIVQYCQSRAPPRWILALLVAQCEHKVAHCQVSPSLHSHRVPDKTGVQQPCLSHCGYIDSFRFI